MFILRPIQKEDNQAMAHVIRTVMPEFGACGPGFAINDAEVSSMFEAYSLDRCRYFVVCEENRIVGGAGVAPLEGGEVQMCELRKMYLMPGTRGKGLGRKLMEACLKAAGEMGYKRCYLETLTNMIQARSLYEKNGFKPLPKPMGNTGHTGCNCWYLKEI